MSPVVVALVIPDEVMPLPAEPPAFLPGLPVPAAPLPAGLFDPGDPPPIAPAEGPLPTAPAGAPPPTAALPMPAAPGQCKSHRQCGDQQSGGQTSRIADDHDALLDNAGLVPSSE